MSEWVLEGRVWNVGDDVGTDSHMMSLDAMRNAITDPEVLATMIFAESFPEITDGARAGDIVVAGSRFGHGNPHNEGWIGIRERGMGVVARTVSRGAYRNAISAGSRLLVGESALADVAKTGQGIRVDFESGVVELDTGERFEYPPLPPELREIVAAGGQTPWARSKLLGAGS
jgi:3-isopropylmalate/(R)-2-methylmalate dehydratase small subunit